MGATYKYLQVTYRNLEHVELRWRVLWRRMDQYKQKLRQRNRRQIHHISMDLGNLTLLFGLDLAKI